MSYQTHKVWQKKVCEGYTGFCHSTAICLTSQSATQPEYKHFAIQHVLASQQGFSFAFTLDQDYDPLRAHIFSTLHCSFIHKMHLHKIITPQRENVRR